MKILKTLSMKSLLFSRFPISILSCVATIIFVGMLASCGSPKFKVDGTIEGAPDKSLLLEKSDFHGRWIVVDSVKTNASGHYSLAAEAPASPEIYRLSLEDQFIYFPVDSIESLTVNSNAKNFGRDFSVEGSDQAKALAQFEKELQKLDVANPEAVKKFKLDVFNKYLREARGSIMSYYVLTKVVGNKPLFDPENDSDIKYYGAVATSFDEFRPNDPHAGMLKSVALNAMRRKNKSQGKRQVIQANEITLIDIDLQNEKGKNVKLSDIARSGKPTVVIFSMMNERESPALNIALSDLYKSKGGNVNFYHISFDNDYYRWRDAARNLPWITVIDPSGMTSNAIRSYNVGSLPTFFIYNAAGNLTDRASSIGELKRKL